MKYQSRKTKIIIAMITVSLAGLMGVQFLLLSIAWQLKDQAFERNVKTALTISAQKLEVGEITGNALDFIYRIEVSDSTQTLPHHLKFFSTEMLELSENTKVTQRDSSRLMRQLTVVMSDDRSELIHRIVDDLVVTPLRPINERLNATTLDSLLRTNLDAVGIALKPELYVYSTTNDSLVITSANAHQNMETSLLRESKYRSRLFALDPVTEAYEIVLLFPGQRSFLLKQVWPLLAASVVFIAAIIAAFVLMLSASSRQHRFADSIVDFINNMTHEFKTPISTVALASEAIARDDILEHPDALKRYNGMIRDENQRMRQQVDRILEIAQLESGDFQLNMISVNIHDLVRNCADNFSLQIENRGGSLNLTLEANDSIVQGDPVHLANMLANLVDNAIKYSPQTPEISLSTRTTGKQLVIEVIDQGIGIGKTDHERVFEKYYRCPTGDRHDVKGFGLGLSYVRLLAHAHGGTVKLDGKIRRGTRIILSLPLISDQLHPGSTK